MVIKKIDILKWYIILYPVCDMLYTVTENMEISSTLNISQIIRGLGLLFLLTYLNWSAKMVLKIGGIFAWMCISLAIYHFSGLSLSLFSDFSLWLKMFTAIVTYYVFKQNFENGTFDYEKIMTWFVYSSYIAISSILLSYVGLGNSSYGSERIGVKGMFTIQSTITGYLLLLFPFIYKSQRKLLSVPVLLSVVALMSIGSKTGVFGTIICYSIFIIYELLNEGRRRVKKSTMLSVSLVMLGILTIGVYYMKKYIVYLLGLYQTKDYFYSLDSFLLSNRNRYIQLVQIYIDSFLSEKQKIMGKIFGYGNSGVRKMMSYMHPELNAIERDFHGLYYCFGIVVLVVISIIIWQCWMNILKECRKYKFRNDICFFSLLSVSLGIVYGWLGGHIIYEAMNLFPFWVICAFCKSKKIQGENI